MQAGSSGGIAARWPRQASSGGQPFRRWGGL